MARLTSDSPPRGRSGFSENLLTCFTEVASTSPRAGICTEANWQRLEKALLALEPTSRIVPTTGTRITANMTAYSEISWPSSSVQGFSEKLVSSARKKAADRRLSAARRSRFITQLSRRLVSAQEIPSLLRLLRPILRVARASGSLSNADESPHGCRRSFLSGPLLMR